MLNWLRRLFSSPRKSLSPDATHPDPEVRRGAAIKLGTVREEWAPEELVFLLGDRHGQVVDAAKASLRQFDMFAFLAIRKGLDHSDPQVGQACAELLGELRRIEVVQPLMVALKYNDRPVQLAAKRALIRCGVVARDAIEASRNESQPWVRQQIDEVLAQLGGSGSPAVGQAHQKSEQA
jgi:HEAT repeat protein